ncbi:YjbH domain-containing protein [Roseovarius salinarum]|uniref:YjbH domain-containing protein n=1 Tax=Roseovarius salinarum TaxID=1981892 RepID=UPI000C32655F|nr:YjbH domain-containing protein [Roseovarius salinarum]
MVAPAQAQDLRTLNTNAYGTHGGLIDMPTAEMAPEGEITTTVSHGADATRTTVTFQATPRLSASFRYSGLTGLRQRTNKGLLRLFTTYYDRSFDLRFRFLDETANRPAVAVGFRDFVGTALYGSEYIVATKSIGEDLRLTGGIGWGRLGSHGAFGSTGSRPNTILGLGGVPTYDQWFRGDVSAFAGASYDLTDRLSFQLEYSSDGYDREVRDGLLDRESSLNVGVDYKIGEAFRLSAYSLYGDELGVSLSWTMNTKEPSVRGGYERAPLPVAVREEAAIADLGWTLEDGTRDTIRGRVAKTLAKEEIELHAFDLRARSARVAIRNPTYGMAPQAVGRTARVLTRTLPASVETLTIVQVVNGIPSSTITFARSDLEKLENAPARDILAAAEFRDGYTLGRDLPLQEDAFPRFYYSVGPYVKPGLFDPGEPLRADAGVRVKGDYQIAPGWVASGSVSLKLLGNLDETPGPRPGQAKAPQVRSNIGLYVGEEDPKIDRLTIANYAKPTRNTYSRVTAGYLESMYAGVSGELLWKPVDSSLAIGAEVNYVEPRDFDQLFDLRTRNTPGGQIPHVSGHLSAYYDLGNGFHTRVDAGRYLAGDWGATLALDREFANGWRVGVFATKTEISSDDFGEGSFDKGIRVTLPIAWGTGKPTTQKFSSTLRPVARDGGQRVHVNGRLYDTVRGTHRPEMAKTWGKFWR